MIEQNLVSESVIASTSSDEKDLVLDILSRDLEQFVAKSKAPNQRIRLISEKTNIHIKTLNRIIKKENRPTYTTVFKIYKYLTDSQSMDELMEKSPKVIADYLVNGNKPSSLVNFDAVTEKHDSEFTDNPIFMEIYVLCSIADMQIQDIQNKFGEYGLQLVNTACAQFILEKKSNNKIALGPKKIFLTPEIIFSMGLTISKRYTKSYLSYENAKNYISFLAEGLSDEGYKKWIEIDEKAYLQKKEIFNNPKLKGTKKVFTFNIVDTLEPGEEN